MVKDNWISLDSQPVVSLVSLSEKENKSAFPPEKVILQSLARRKANLFTNRTCENRSLGCIRHCWLTNRLCNPSIEKQSSSLPYPDQSLPTKPINILGHLWITSGPPLRRILLRCCLPGACHNHGCQGLDNLRDTRLRSHGYQELHYLQAQAQGIVEQCDPLHIIS